MKITLLLLGKTTSPEVKRICDDYRKRINHYMKMEEVIIDNSNIKIADKQKIKEKEGELLLKKITSTDFVILLDDKGKEFTSIQFSQYLANIFNQSGHYEPVSIVASPCRDNEICGSFIE